METVNRLWASVSNTDWNTVGAAGLAIANQPIVCALLPAIVGLILAQRVNKVAEEEKSKERAKQKAMRDEDRANASLLAEDSDQEAPATTEATSAGASAGKLDPVARAVFKKASTDLQLLKDFVDATADRVKDGRTKRKYDNIGRTDYRVITNVLAGDGGLSAEASQELTVAFDIWRTYKNGMKIVPPEVAARLQKLAARHKVTEDYPARWKPIRS